MAGSPAGTPVTGGTVGDHGRNPSSRVGIRQGGFLAAWSRLFARRGDGDTSSRLLDTRAAAAKRHVSSSVGRASPRSDAGWRHDRRDPAANGRRPAWRPSSRTRADGRPRLVGWHDGLDRRAPRRARCSPARTARARPDLGSVGGVLVRNRPRQDVGQGRPGGLLPRDRADGIDRRHRPRRGAAGRRRGPRPRPDHHRARRRTDPHRRRRAARLDRHAGPHGRIATRAVGGPRGARRGGRRSRATRSPCGSGVGATRRRRPPRHRPRQRALTGGRRATCGRGRTISRRLAER